MANLKRIATWEDGPPTKLAKKSPVCTLHEMYRDVQFKLIKQEGPVHSPTFTISVYINGAEYEGKGRNKKVAKQAAAINALQSMVQLEQPEKGIGFTNATNLMDFTCDVPVAEDKLLSSIKVRLVTLLVIKLLLENGAYQARVLS